MTCARFTRMARRGGDSRGGSRRAALFLLPLAALVLGTATCDSPTLPLPPPADPVVTVSNDTLCDGTMYANVGANSGSAIPGALIMVFNHNTDSGSIIVAGPNGDYATRVAVDFSQATRNVIDVWQRDVHGDSAAVHHLVSKP